MWRRRELAREFPSWSRNLGRPLSPGGPRRSRQAAAADDIPVFDRNKVSLDLPGSLFGPSVSLLIRTTKVIGDVIQVSPSRCLFEMYLLCTLCSVCENVFCYRTRRCATRRSCACSGHFSVGLLKSRAWTRPPLLPPPPPPHAAPPARRTAPQTMKCAAADGARRAQLFISESFNETAALYIHRAIFIFSHFHSFLIMR